jgi:DNA replication and repair protein RecF
MWVRSLEVVDFRSYEWAQLDLAAGPVVFVGANGQGKTNLVEAIAYAASLDSHRAHSDAPLVAAGADRAIIRLTACVGSRDVRIELEVNAGRANRARLNGAPLPRTRDVLGVLRCVTFAPEDLRLVKGDPADRRRFLDGVMIQAAPRYAGIRSDFERALKQRNALLRAGAAGRRDDFDASLRVWNDRYLPLAVELTWGRLNAVRRLTSPVAAAYAEISPTADTAAISYEAASGADAAGSRQDVADLLVGAIRQRHDEEVRRGMTLVGPHRDDVAISLNAMPAKTHASHGEAWSLALALRLASFDVLDEIGGDPPVLILDDVFAELDQMRRSRLVGAARRAEQTLVTAAVPGDVPAELVGQQWSVAKDGTSRVQPGL